MKKTLLLTLAVSLCLALAVPLSSCSWFGSEDYSNTETFAWKKVKDAGDTVVAVTAPDAGRAWAACLKGDILVDDGGSWELQHHIEGNLAGMCSLDADHAWVVGKTLYEQGVKVTGFVYSWDGTRWAKEYGTEDVANDVFALDSTHVWVACDGGGIRFFDGKDWIILPGLEDEDCLSVAAAGADRVWVGTRDGIIHMYDGATWSTTYEGAAPVRDIYAYDRDHAWAAVGDAATREGRVLYYGGNSWDTQYTASSGALMAVSGTGPDRVWAVGNRPSADYALLDANVYFFDGTSWIVQAEIPETLSSIAAYDGENAWAGGNEGGIYLGSGE